MTARVLFVDDEPDLTEGVRCALRKEPYEILTANSAQEALGILETTEIDVVVSDEGMPEMRGSEFLSIVRRDYPQTIRMILTGQASLDAAVDAINKAEIYRFLLKPCPPSALALCLEQAIEAKRQKILQQQRSQAGGADRKAELTSIFERGLSSLWMVFQPVISVSKDRTFGFEALVRTGEPAVSQPPNLFDIAEELERLWELERLIRKTVADAAEWVPDDALIFVNIHPRSLDDPMLSSDEEPLRPLAERTVLEITERAPLEEIQDAQKKVAALRKLGYRIAVDDLGAGYAGLTTFPLLKPDFVKFDMSLVRNIQTSPTKAKLLASFTCLCKELDILPIAEGVESVEERDRLVELGCDLLQGYQFARPTKMFHRPD